MRKYIYHPLVVISLLHLIINILLFNENGVKNVNDSHRYLEYANNMKNGFYFDQHNFWYLGYAIFIFIVQQFYNSELAIIIAQNILSWIAVICIYKSSKLIFNNPKSAFITSICYILFIEILSWNSYILCESVYCSFISISFYLLAKIYSGSVDVRTITSLALIASLTILTKPTGIALLGAIFIVVILQTKFHLYGKIFRGSLFLIGSVAILLLINKMLTTYLVMENYQLGEIIYDITTIKYKTEYESVIVSVPDYMYIPSKELPPIIRILSFIIHNPIYWTKLFIGKIFYFLIHIRPYWSIQHNIFSLVFLLPLYFYTVRGMIKKTYNTKILVFFISYLFIHVLSVGITSVDWDGRFLMPLLPAIFIMASPEIVVDFERLISLTKDKYRVTRQS